MVMFAVGNVLEYPGTHSLNVMSLLLVLKETARTSVVDDHVQSEQEELKRSKTHVPCLYFSLGVRKCAYLYPLAPGRFERCTLI